MTPEERDWFMVRVLAAWPTPKMPDEQRGVWFDHLTKMDDDRARRALAKLERSSKHRPTLADLHAAYDAERGDHAAHVQPECSAGCDDGFVWTRCNGCDCGDRYAQERCPLGYHTMDRCPSGCVPLTMDQRAARNHAEDRAWERDRAAARAGVPVGARDFTEATHRMGEEPF